MPARQEGADKTEKPTPRRLREARKQGDVSRSRELTSTVSLLGWLALFWILLPSIYRRLEALITLILNSLDQPFAAVIGEIGPAAFHVFLLILTPLLIAALLIALVTEFLQVGPVIAPSKAKPDASRLNPADGLKRMFSQENLVEVVKSLFKTLVLAGILIAVLFTQIGELLRLTTAPPAAMGEAQWHVFLTLGAWTIFAFFFVSVLDVAYQKFVYIKNLRMSRRDIRRELRDDEGDPQVKARRRQLHEEWATRNILEAVRSSSVVVTNPTHIAIALLYEPGETVVPVVAAKGVDHLAQLMREAAEEARVPVMQNIDLARGLYERAQTDEFVPSEFFEAVAEVLRWADSVRASREHPAQQIEQPTSLPDVPDDELDENPETQQDDPGRDPRLDR